MSVNQNEIILYTENVTKKFGGLIAVNDVSINCKKNEILAVIGANGAGKTTMFNMLAGAFAPTSGKIYFEGKDISAITCDEACAIGIGRTFQIVKPFENMTVLDNVMVGALLHYPKVSDAREKAMEVLERVGLAHRAKIKGAMLNLPERKRLEFARALATEPRLLLLDEVMAGLNPTQCEDVMELIKRLRADGLTIIMIEHIMKVIMSISDRIYVMNQGKLIAEGTPAEVSSNPAVISSYLGEKKIVKDR